MTCIKNISHPERFLVLLGGAGSFGGLLFCFAVLRHTEQALYHKPYLYSSLRMYCKSSSCIQAVGTKPLSYLITTFLCVFILELTSQLLAAENKCNLLEKQLEYMRNMIKHAEMERTSVLEKQV